MASISQEVDYEQPLVNRSNSICIKLQTSCITQTTVAKNYKSHLCNLPLIVWAPSRWTDSPALYNLWWHSWRVVYRLEKYAGIINAFCLSAELLMLRRDISFCLSGSFIPFPACQLISGMDLGLGSAVLRTLFIVSANLSFIYSQQECIGAQMTPFPAQWHHLAVEDVLNFHSYSSRLPPAHSFQRLAGHFSGFINFLRQYSVCLLVPSFSPHTFTARLSLSDPPPYASLFTLLHCVHRWQLRSSGALRGAEKTKIWFSGSDLDFLQIGWKIRKSFYSYTKQSLPLQLETMTADHRGCSYQCKCAICDKASVFST